MCVSALPDRQSTECTLRDVRTVPFHGQKGMNCLFEQLLRLSMPDDVVDESNGQALLQSFSMIILSEIGDKTFLIAAILAMRHPRLIVFAGAFGSLVVMSLLSAALGNILPRLIPKKWTQVAAGVLFLVFGAKMWLEGKAMVKGNEKVLEEIQEVEEEIQGDEILNNSRAGMIMPLDALEAGRVSPTPKRKNVAQGAGMLEGARSFCSILFGPIFVQAFVLTFLGEWGDRSQIATIALGAAHVSITSDHLP
jgi:putative Ca2+/H+ antiporter (TMEM165/GDT1 family)